VTPDDEIKALTHAIARLETDLRASSSQAEQSHIRETLQVLRGMRAYIVAETGAKLPKTGPVSQPGLSLCYRDKPRTPLAT
jgi:hypothetical protein